MKVLTTAQMREVDRRSIELGIPGLILMENAGSRVVEFLAGRFSPLNAHRIVVLCGKGNNGGDGMVIARQLHTRFRPKSLDVVLAFDPAELSGEAAANCTMLQACGCPVNAELRPSMQAATLVIDALLGTGLSGPARGTALDLIRAVNEGFPLASVVSVDTPSGLHPEGESVRAQCTVTFTAPKIEQVLAPGCDRTGDLIIAPIGSPPSLWEADPNCWLSLAQPEDFKDLLAPRAKGAHKGNFGHVLVFGGSPGKGGAAAMAGLAALRAGAGLVTVATAEEERRTVTSLAPELMTQSISANRDDKDILAIGPGLGDDPGWVTMSRHFFASAHQSMVVDADGLNALAGTDFRGPGPLRVLTPHPGEMSRLTGHSIARIQASRLESARLFAIERNVAIVLKGQRTVVAFADGRVWINPTGTPAMATAGSGDILTGLMAGMLAQFPGTPDKAILAAVWLHGRAGEIAARHLAEPAVIATDLLRFLPEAIREVQPLSN